jgi:hypothetical protein
MAAALTAVVGASNGGSASTRVEVLARLGALRTWSTKPTWTSLGDPHEKGMEIDSEYGFFFHEGMFGDVTTDRDPEDGSLQIRVEWKGREGDRNSIADMTRDFYMALGVFVEQACFVEREERENEVVFWMATGSASHGHTLRVTLIGPLVEEVLKQHRAAAASWRQTGGSA